METKRRLFQGGGSGTSVLNAILKIRTEKSALDVTLTGAIAQCGGTASN